MPDQNLRKGKNLRGKEVFKVLATLSHLLTGIKQLKTEFQVLMNPEAKSNSLLVGF